MKIITLLLISNLTFLISNYSSAQAPNWFWARSAGGATDDVGNSVATDAGGNVYVTGYFGSSSITFGGTTLLNAGYTDVFLVKYDASGNVLWAKSAGGPGYDWGQSLTTDASGNVYVTGWFSSDTITFGSTSLNALGSNDVFIAKYDYTGNVVWAKSAGGIDDDKSHAITTDAAGNVLITGWFWSSAITFGTTTLMNTAAFSSDIFIVKYDSSGNVLWAQSDGGSNADFGNSIVTDGNSNIFITGYFYSDTLTFGSTTLMNTGQRDIFVVKYDSTGNAVWAKSAGTSGDDAGNGIISNEAGIVTVTGYFYNSSITFDSITLTNAGSYDIFIVRYDSSGNVVWAKSAGGASDDEDFEITSDASDNVFITGWFMSSQITFNSIPLFNVSAGSYDVFVVKYDASGNAVWAKSAGGISDDWGYDIAEDSNGNVLITGLFHSASITFGNDSLINAGNGNMFVAKLASSPTEIGEISNERGAIIYPNPTKGNLTIQFSSQYQAGQNDVELIVFNMVGQEISTSFYNNTNTINFSIDASPGFYIVKVTTRDGKTELLKFIKL